MSMRKLLLLFSLPLLLAAVDPPPAADPSHACGDLIRQVTTNNDSYGIALAIDVYNCYTTVPFNPAVATRLVQYWNDTLQFQIDLLAGIQDIQSAIDSGAFANEYQFEAALQSLLYSAHDAHVSFVAGVLSAFTFGSSYGLSSVSIDGVQAPKVYLTDDLIQNQTSFNASAQPNAITHINGTDYPLWGGDATFYPGDIFNYTFEDGSTLSDEWLAIYYDPGPTGPLETGGDFYNLFALGFYPASFNESDIPNDEETCVPSSSFADAELTTAYPLPDIAQADLTCSGYTTGYYFNDSSVAVLSIPTFWAQAEPIQAFTDAVQQFIDGAKATGISKVVIDLQQNNGGDVLMAYTVFKQFFPAIEPFSGSFMRAHSLANNMGSLITDYWDTLETVDTATYVNGSSDEWIATIRLNAASGANFSSWDEFYGPYTDGIEGVTAIERLNTSNFAFDYSAFGAVNPPEALLSPYTGAAPFAAENMMMLSDGLCSSACSVFMEMMNHEAGVKNVVIGGRPQYGPMQTPSGSRGALYYALDELDADTTNAASIYEAESTQSAAAMFPNRTEQDIFVYGGGVSLRAAIRKGENVPLAMQYLAADCRILWTPSTFNNFTNLWHYAVNAMWSTPELCLQNSTGYATTLGVTPLPPPVASPPAAIKHTGIDITSLAQADVNIPFLFSDNPMPDVGGGFLPRPQTQIGKLEPSIIQYLSPKEISELQKLQNRATLHTKQPGKLNKNTKPSSKRRRRRSLAKH